MTEARTKLKHSIKSLSKYVAHTTGYMPGGTSSYEKTAITTGEKAGILSAALDSGNSIGDELSEFESAFMAMATLSTATLHGPATGQISDTEVDKMLELIDAVRREEE